MDLRTLTYNYYIQDRERPDIPAEWPADWTFLDIGCGLGWAGKHLRNYLGLDLMRSPGFDRSRPFIQGNALRLPLRDASVDAFLSFSLLEHLSDPVPALREMYRVCRHGGVIGVPTYDEFPALYDPVNWVLRRQGKGPCNFGIGGFGHVHVVPAEEWKRMFREAGFREVVELRRDRLDAFAALEFMFLSIFFSHREYGEFVGGLVRGGEAWAPLKRVLGLLYSFIKRINWTVKGSPGSNFIVRK